MNGLLLDEPPPPDSVRTLLDDILAEQQSLTAVARFARKHEALQLPAQARYYRDLIPLEKPGLGEQYAFGVDLDACTGCKACVSACHSLNGLDEDEIWRNVGLVHGGTSDAPYQQTITTACHHCVEPACLEGCPVQAYEKDAVTGIVRHLDDQCIGCHYCVLKCPYDVPKYSARRGIVRKCDMCHSRLAASEAPACVQACPNGAISIRVVEKSEVQAQTRPGERLVPGAFDSHYTQPTTRYTTGKTVPANARASDAPALRLEPAHWPLIGMLVLSQLAAGLGAAASTLALLDPARFADVKTWLAVSAFVALQLGLAVSVLHLGRPLGAWRAFLGLRTSWMSREIFAFGALAAAASGFVASSLWPWIARVWPVARFFALEQFAAASAHLTAASAVLAVFCSAMIYVDTHRDAWNAEQTFTKFFGSMLLLGAAGAAALLGTADGGLTEAARAFAIGAVFLRTALFGWEFLAVHHALLHGHSPLHRPALLLWKRQRPLLFVRLGLFAASTAAGLLACGRAGAGAAAVVALGLTLASVVAERFVFFTTVVAHRMPGSPAHRP